MKKKVLYLAAGNPIQPSVGMDLVVGEHLKELAASDDLDVTAIAVAPGIKGQPDAGRYSLAGLPVRLFVGDLLKEPGGIGRLGRKLRLITTHPVPVMAYSFKSDEAAAEISRLFAQNEYDVVVVDHYYALTNIRFHDLKKYAGKLVYISHDAMFPHIGEMANMKEGGLAKVYYRMEAIRTHFVERQLFDLAANVVHLSEYERAQVKDSVEKHVALLPPVCSKDAVLAMQAPRDPRYAHSIVFIGSPGHPPNAHALDWILNRFGPVLARTAPDVEIALIGGGTDRLPKSGKNIKGYGFVSSEQMQSMLASCICSISPVTKGRGIKIKVLDAIASGCPVLATEESLRGFERFGLKPDIQQDNPEALAETVKKMAQSDRLQTEAREAMKQAWASFLQQRTGQLAQVVRAAV
ncbi:MAG: glycosyltransferase [Acidobacteriota bacterium]